MPLPRLTASRYLVPLREGGSLPAVVETEDGGRWVLKFRGAGQREKALVAELIVGQLAARLGLPVPDLALIELDAAFGRGERDPEIQDLLRGSEGLNVGLRYLEGAFNYDPVAFEELVAPDLAADTVWLDALVTNIDRSPRNPNILIWERKPWLIDHGAALYFQHRWSALTDETPMAPFPAIGDHVLLPRASDLAAADARLAPRIDAALLEEILATVPDELLLPPGERRADFEVAAEVRAAFRRYLTARLEAPRAFVAEAECQRLLRRAEASEGGPPPLQRRR